MLNENITKELKSFDIVISNATAKWKNNLILNSLENINLNVRSGQLVAIIGPVGAGKVYIKYMIK